jgi:hypothetical protein
MGGVRRFENSDTEGVEGIKTSRTLMKVVSAPDGRVWAQVTVIHDDRDSIVVL